MEKQKGGAECRGGPRCIAMEEMAMQQTGGRGSGSGVDGDRGAEGRRSERMSCSSEGVC